MNANGHDRNSDLGRRLNQETPQPMRVIPTCGFCNAGKEPPFGHGVPITLTTIQMGPMVVGVFHCGNPDCGSVFSVEVLQMAVPAQAQASDKGLIVTGGE